MSIDTWVEGSPGECRESARRLARLAAVVEESRSELAAQAAPGGAGFEGLAAMAYRARCTRLSLAARGLGEQVALLADALAVLAADLVALRSVMARLRAVARGRLPVQGWVVLPPADDADPGLSALHRRLAGVAADARALEHQAQARYRAALSGATGLLPADEGFGPPVAGPLRLPGDVEPGEPAHPPRTPPVATPPSAPPAEPPSSTEPDREPPRDTTSPPSTPPTPPPPRASAEAATAPVAGREPGAPPRLVAVAGGSLPVLAATLVALHRRLDALLTGPQPTHEEVDRDDDRAVG